MANFCCQASWSDYLSFTVEEAVARAGITYRRGSCRRSTSTEARCATACLFTGTVHSVSLSFRWSRAFRLQASIICCVCSPPHKQKNPKIFWSWQLFHGLAHSLDREARGFGCTGHHHRGSSIHCNAMAHFSWMAQQCQQALGKACPACP